MTDDPVDEPTTDEGRDMLDHCVQYSPADADRKVTGAKIAAVERAAERATNERWWKWLDSTTTKPPERDISSDPVDDDELVLRLLLLLDEIDCPATAAAPSSHHEYAFTFDHVCNVLNDHHGDHECICGEQWDNPPKRDISSDPVDDCPDCEHTPGYCARHRPRDISSVTGSAVTALTDWLAGKGDNHMTLLDHIPAIQREAVEPWRKALSWALNNVELRQRNSGTYVAARALLEGKTDE